MIQMKRSFLLLFLLPLFCLSQTTLSWEFPIHRPHAGVLLGNGTQGLMVWGKQNQLIITIGRAGFWDHRGGNDFTANITYDELEALLLARNDSAIRKAFANPEATAAGGFGRPQQLGCGRLVITMPEACDFQEATLDLKTGTILIHTRDPQAGNILIRQNPHEEFSKVEFSGRLQPDSIRFISAYDMNTAAYQKAGISEPGVRRGGGQQPEIEIITQRLPQDSALSFGWMVENSTLTLGTGLGEDAEAELLGAFLSNANNLIPEDEDFWNNYWSTAPIAQFEDPILQEIFDYGLYKQACVTPPQGIPATLQGPFMEDYQIVPWSNDYHFNINIEMIYYPALMSGKYDHLMPMWEMIHRWWEELSTNGETFFGLEGAMMLPHAVDDRGKVVGTFWTGTIDHACTAWMAQLAWLHYSYSGDEAVLRETAFPLLKGAFEGYWAMLDQEEDGSYHLPVSVSPEYRGSRMDAWGKDASFQLAALHAICNILPEAADLMDEEADPRWKDVSDHLAPYTIVDGVYHQEWRSGGERIGLWEGMDLIESHRHHSHLASIWPFITIDPFSEANNQIISTSMRAWRMRGAGAWSGWCVPWAAILAARVGHTEGAINWLHYWRDNFVNEGRGTLHNANNGGHSVIGGPVWGKYTVESRIGEVMQLDAGFGALTALFDLMVRQDIHGLHVLPFLSLNWKNMSFERVRAEGGFIVSAEVIDGFTSTIEIEATRDQELILFPHISGEYIVSSSSAPDESLQMNEEKFSWEMKAGEVLSIRRVD